MHKTWTVSLFVLACLCLAPGVSLGDSVSIPLIGQTHDVAAIHGYLDKPKGSGPFPAVILQHGCAGLARATRERAEHWTRFYRELGHVTLITDSFTARGWYGCRNRDPNSDITMFHRVVDAYSALAFLSVQPFIDRDRVVLEGMSHGARAVWQALSEADPTGKHGKFVAGIAFYPNCLGFSPHHLKAPLLILIGAKDGTTRSAYCLSPRDAKPKFDYRLNIFADATHAYDIDRPGRYFRGDYRNFHPQATADSAKQIEQFLTLHVLVKTQ